MTTVIVNDLMQRGYTYELSAPEGADFASDFNPDLNPREMLHLGIFGGKYMTDCGSEFPLDWFKGVEFCHKRHIPEFNYFLVNAGQSLFLWRKNGWIHEDDPRGWFQWYCRYYRGRRIPPEDRRQIDRWKSFKRHLVQVIKNCNSRVVNCRRKQRQALLQWAYDTRNI